MRCAKACLRQATARRVQRDDIIGILSLILWALMVIVTVKYVLILLRADNQGEGGTLSLLALAQRAWGGGSLGAGDGADGGCAVLWRCGHHPGDSVLSAVEGLKLVTAS